MGIMLWDNIDAKLRILKSDIKLKTNEIDRDSILDGLNKVEGFLKEQNESSMKKFQEYLKNQPDSVILHNMKNAETEQGKRLCRDEAKRRGLI